MNPTKTSAAEPLEAEELVTDEDEFLFEVAQEPQSERDVEIAAAGKRCWCYCYCTRG
jgi:hypothetical protein